MSRRPPSQVLRSLRVLLPALACVSLAACPGNEPELPTKEGLAPAPIEAIPSMSDPTDSSKPTADAQDQAARERPDPHSFGRPDQVRVEHMGLSWVVDFDAETLTGDAVLLLDRIDEKAPLILDSRDLDIKQIYAATLDVAKGEHGVPELSTAAARGSSSFAETKWTVEAAQTEPDLGSAIVIDLPEGANVVKLTYTTRPGATGLQWLDPAQTAGKNEPFLYSQSQAIHGRSWIPCQDSPGVRTTWDAEVVVDPGLTAVMAAEQLGLALAEGAEGDQEPSPDEAQTFRFVMPQPVPAYLIAIGVGELEQRSVGERTAVWADPAVVAAAADEFADMEAMLTSAEALYGDYAWGRYDVLVLPPAFPFGGMENPRLTFATPTILAGDRSLVSLIAHELAHSWSGNLVTNSTWGDLWLNEGFTVYFERRIVEAIYGAEQAEVEAVIGKRELVIELAEELKDTPEYQVLDADLVGKDPDDYFSGVPYEKGYLLLRSLEQAYGREVFDAFLRAWFDSHAFGSVSTEEFRKFVGEELVDTHKPLEGQSAVDLDAWITGPGLPEGAPQPEAEVLDSVEAEAKAFATGDMAAKALSSKKWSPWLWLHFLRSLPEGVEADKLAELDEAHALTASTNSEILGQWLVLAASARYEPANERMEAFLIEVGRRKFLTPIYRALVETPAGKAQAQAIYAKARPGYHSISRRSLDEIVGAPE